MNVLSFIFPSLRLVIERKSILLPASVESGRAVHDPSFDRDLGLDEISGDGLQIDIDSEADSSRRPDLAMAVAIEMLGGQRAGERLQGYRVFRNSMAREPRIGLQRLAERQMRRVGVVDIVYALFDRMRRHRVRRADAADPSAIDLHEADLAEIDEVARHQLVMGRFSAGEADLWRDRGERGMGGERMTGEGLLEPQRPRLLERRQPARRRSNVLAEDLPGIDEQRRIRSDPLPRRHQLIDVGAELALAERPPAELHGTVAGSRRSAPPLKRFLRGIAEELRSIGRFSEGLLKPEQAPD